MKNEKNILIDIENITDPLEMELKKERITADYIAKKLKAELEATTIKFLKDGDRDERVAVEEIDWATRQRARMDTQRLRGDYPSEKTDINFPNNNSELPPGIQKMIDKITVRRKQ
jgi:hypothetical protein